MKRQKGDWSDGGSNLLLDRETIAIVRTIFIDRSWNSNLGSSSNLNSNMNFNLELQISKFDFEKLRFEKNVSTHVRT